MREIKSRKDVLEMYAQLILRTEYIINRNLEDDYITYLHNNKEYPNYHMFSKEIEEEISLFEITDEEIREVAAHVLASM